nr:SDR family oxidoreductase [uncultured Mogibacterium sp.]
MNTQTINIPNKKSVSPASGLACITGASSGIGAEFARQLAAEGYSVILVARREDRLVDLGQELASDYHVECECITADLSDLNECAELIAYLKSEREMPLDILINNAGFGAVGRFDQSDVSKDLNMIDVNVRALHYIAHQMLPHFIERDHGHIINVGSVAGLMPGGPYMATYYATKSYVVSLTNAIAEELKRLGSHVQVHALCPGPVNTEFNDVANVKFSLKGISAKECVSYCIDEADKGKIIIVPNKMVKLAAVAVKFVPREIVLGIVARSQKSKIER